MSYNQETKKEKQVDLGKHKSSQSPQMPNYLKGPHCPDSTAKTSNTALLEKGKKVIENNRNAFSFEAPSVFMNKFS